MAKPITASSVAALNIDPKTGLSSSTKPSTVTLGKATELLTKANIPHSAITNPVSQALVGGGEFLHDVDAWEDTDVRYGADNEENRAKSQSVSGIIAKSAGRFVTGTAAKLLQGAGYAITALPALAVGDFDVMVDNAFSATMEESEQSMKDAMPIYATNAYKNGNLKDQMSSAAFWGGDFTDGLSFLASAWIQGAGLSKALEATALSAKAARGISSMTKAARLGKRVGNTAASLGKWAEAADLATISAFNTTIEAAFEAKDTKEGILNGLKEKIDLGIMTPKEANEIAGTGARNTFVMNMAALAPSNMIETAMLFKTPKSLNIRGLVEEARLGKTIGKEAIEGSAKQLSNMQMAGIFAKDAMLSALSEGAYEENIQTAIQNYNEKKALGKENRGMIEGIVTNMVDNFGTTEGLKSIVLGSITGLVPGGYSGVRDAKQARINDAAVTMARGTMLNSMTNQAQDYYKRQTLKDKDGKVIGDADSIVVDKDGKPVLDEKKIAAAFQHQYETQYKFIESLKASASGNETMFNYIRNNVFANQILPLINTKATDEEIENTIDFYAEKEIEDLGRTGKPADKKAIEELKQDYKDKAFKLKNIHSSISNNYAGIADFGKSKEANDYKSGLLYNQYNEAADQLFWEDEKRKSLAEGDEVKAGQIDSVLKESYVRMKDLLDFKKQEKLFKGEKSKQEKNDITIQSDTDDAVVTKTTQGTVVNKEGLRTPSNNLSTTEALAHGYKVDAEASNNRNLKTGGNEASVFTKTVSKGHTNTVLTDGTKEGNIVKTVDTFEKNFVDNKTGESKKAGINFANGILDSIKVRNEQGDIEELQLPAKQDGTPYLTEDIEDLTHVIQAITPLQLNEKQKVDSSRYNELISVRDRYANNDSQIVRQVTDKVKNDVNDDLHKKLKVKLDYKDVRIKDSFDSGIKYLPAKYKGNTGIVFNDNGTLSFKDQDTKQITAITAIDSDSTFSDVNVDVLSDIATDTKIHTDGREYNIEIQGRNFKNPYNNPSDAVYYYNGKVAQVVLQTEEGKTIAFKDPTIAKDLAYAIELTETVKQKVFNDYLTNKYGDFMFILDPISGNKYATFLKDGDFVIYNTEGKPVKVDSNVYRRVSKQASDMLNRAIEYITSKNLEQYNNKTLKDELTGILKDLRTPTATEAVRIPGGREVKATERVQTYLSPVIDGTTEWDIKLGSKIQGAIDSVVPEQTDVQETATGDNTTIFEGNEVEDTSYSTYIAEHGIKHSATALSYVSNDPANGKYITRNKEFEIDVINNNIDKAYAVPFINTSYEAFWQGRNDIKFAIEKGKKFTDEEIDALLELKTPEVFTNLVDTFPIGLKHVNGEFTTDSGLFVHDSNYDFLYVPASVRKSGDVRSYKNTIKAETRKAREGIIRRLLKGEEIVIPYSDKTAGTPNYSGSNKNIMSVLNKIHPDMKSKDVVIGVATGLGDIITSEGRTDVGFGSRGNVYMISSHTANNTEMIFKLNPSKLSAEHANIVLKCFKQAIKKGSGGLRGIYSDNDVTGGLSRIEVLNMLVVQGEKFTKVGGDNNVPKHLLNKQLYSKDGKLFFGDDSLDLNSATIDDVGRFIKWATTNKNYAIDAKLISKPAHKSNFSIGSTINYNKDTDNYSSMLIDSGMLLTDLDVVDGTKSLTKQPLIITDLKSAGIEYDLNDTDVVPIPVDKVVVDKPVKVEEKKIEPTTGNVSAERLPLKFTDFMNMPVGSSVYLLGTDEATKSETKEEWATIKEIDGENHIVFNPNVSGLMVGFKKFFKTLGNVKVNDIPKLKQMQSEMGLLKSMFYFDTPAITTEPKKEDTVKPEDIQPRRTRNRGLQSDNPFNFRMRETAPKYYDIIDIDKETQWLKDRFKQNRLGKDISIKHFDSLIKLAGDRLAFGQFTRDAISLSKLAETGTAYHEAFHRVSLGYLSDSEREGIYEDARQKYNLKDATDNEVEEMLAEEFRKYTMLDKDAVKLDLPTKIKQFFKDLWNFIKTWFTGRYKLDNIETESLFKAIEKGRYKYATISRNRYEELRGESSNFEAKGVKLNTVNTQAEYTEVIHSLFYLLAESNNLIGKDEEGELIVKLSGLNDVRSIELGNLYHAVENKIKLYEDIIANAKESIAIVNDNPTKEELEDIKQYDLDNVNIRNEEVHGRLLDLIATSERVMSVMTEVKDKFKVYSESLSDYMQSLKITTVFDQESTDEVENGAETNQSEIDRYNNRAHFESSAKNNTAANIKLLLSILPASRERSTITGLPKFTDFSSLWSKIYRDLAGSTDIDEMVQKLTAKSDNNLPYSVLLKCLSKDELLRTQFFKTFSKQRLDFINALVELDDKGTPNIVFGGAAIQTASAKLVKEWNSTLYKNNSLFTHTESGVAVDKQGFANLFASFNSLYRNAKTEFNSKGTLDNYEDYFQVAKDIINRIGIGVTDSEFRYIVGANNSTNFINFLNTHMANLVGPDSSLYKLANDKRVVSDRGGKKVAFDFTNVFQNEKSVKYIAEAVAESDPRLQGDSVLGPDGAKYYTVSQHTTISNTIDKFKANPELLGNIMNSAIYNKNSYMLDQLYNKGKIKDFKLKTLASFVREDESDTGRGYQSITDMEDYLLRIVANDKGLLTPPTPADRNFYSFISGIDKLDGKYDNDGKLYRDTVAIFKGYYMDEYNRVANVRQQIKNVIDEIADPKDLVENLHYTVPKSTKKKEGDVWVGNKLLMRDGKYQGRGAYLTHFDGMDIKKDMSDSMIEKVLNNVINKEIDKAIKFKLIEKRGDKLVNKLIPEHIINNIISEMQYTGKHEDVQDQAVRSAIADFAVNQMMTVIEYGKVFTGDPAAYKSTEDQVKRITGFTSTGDNTRNSFPSTYYPGDRLVHAQEYNIATFSSYVFKSKHFDELVNRFVDFYMENGIESTREDAELRANTVLDSYLKVDRTDAQTFITPAMYRALSIKLGEWSDKKEAAYNIVTNPESTAKDKVLAYEVVMQPLKMTYMGVKYENGNAFPVFDKMSMATLYRPVVKGTPLEDLLDRMEAVGKYEGMEPIDHVKFHTAFKVGIQDRTDFYKDKEETTVNIEGLSIYKQNFANIRMQLVTDPHEPGSIPTGSQVKKVSIMNVDMDSIYDAVGKSGRELISEVHDILSNLSDRGLKKYKSSFHLTDTFEVEDKEAFMNVLKEEAKKANMPDYIIDSFKMSEKEPGNFYLEIDAHPGTRKWTQTRIISNIKKAVIDLELPGSVFIQMSNIGSENIKFDDKGKKSIDEDSVLKMFNERGNIECRVSTSLFATVIPNYGKKTHQERVDYLRKNPHLTALAYRVPTQGQNSVYTIEVKDFLEDTIGDVIIFPSEGTTIGGFDFFRNIRVTA